MPNIREQRLPKQQVELALRSCPMCAGFARRIDRLIGLRDGKPVALYECEKCCELIWDD